jgi:hypothetical protein
LPSSQFGGAPPTHAPLLQVSFVVHALPSSHGAVLFVFTQPLTGSHESSVHTLPSSQFGGNPPTHAPLPQVSLVVQASPSSHATPSAFAGLEHWPVAGSQVPASWH